LFKPANRLVTGGWRLALEALGFFAFYPVVGGGERAAAISHWVLGYCSAVLRGTGFGLIGIIIRARQGGWAPEEAALEPRSTVRGWGCVHRVSLPLYMTPPEPEPRRLVRRFVQGALELRRLVRRQRHAQL
jgi:hypothetical protein